MDAYDVVIVGGGPVGASLVCALSNSGLRVALIEASSWEVIDHSSAGMASKDDVRGLALAQASLRILEGIGVWDDLAAHATPILGIHVSERGHFGAVRLSAADSGVRELAQVVPARRLGEALQRAVMATPNCDLHSPASVTDVRCDEGSAGIVIKTAGRTQTLRTRLLAIADGTLSSTRALLGVRVREHDYGQTAIVANVRPSRPHRNIAYERFTPGGPIAVLPQADGWCGVVNVVPATEAAGVANASDPDFLRHVQVRFGNRLGRFEAAGRRTQYSLRSCVAESVAGARYVLLGNAAHTMHPNAAQGLNLGLRDVAVLAELLHDAARRGGDTGAPACTASFAERTRADQTRTVRMTGGIARLFYNESLPLTIARQCAMLAIEALPVFKRGLIRRASGLSGSVPRLARGVTL